MVPTKLTKPPRTVRHYPTLGLAALQAELVPALRVWLTLQALDPEGSGRLRYDNDLCYLLTVKRSKWRLYKSKRALRRVLAQGDGIFWNRNNGHIRLQSPDKVANAIGSGRMAGLPVLLPMKALSLIHI